MARKKKVEETVQEQQIVEDATADNVVFTVHRSLYAPDVLFGTAFAFLDRCYVFLDVVDDDRTSVELTARAGTDIVAVAGEFRNELVTQSVRLDLARETEALRTLIVGRAIGQAMPREAPRNEGQGSGSQGLPDLPPEVARILAEEEDSLDFLDDPLGIAVPWEEKHEKKPIAEPMAEPVAEPVTEPVAVEAPKAKKAAKPKKAEPADEAPAPKKAPTKGKKAKAE